MKQCVVYSIVNASNGKVYIGGSVDFYSRKHAHLCALRRNRHPNRVLQGEWNAYGADAFSFNIIEHATRDTINNREKWWILHTKCTDPARGYNTRIHETIKRTRTVSQQARQAISKGLKGRRWSPEQRLACIDLQAPRRRPVIDFDGTIYESQTAAARATGMPQANISRQCRVGRTRKFKNKPGRHFFSFFTIKEKAA